MRKLLLLPLLLCITTALAIAQEVAAKKTLQQQMWGFTGPWIAAGPGCVDFQYEEDGDIWNNWEEYSWIDDTKNGYLRIIGVDTPCGGEYGVTIGAYKKADGSYMLLRHRFDVSYPNYFMATNENFETILPPEIDLKYFYKPGAVADTTRIYYSIYIDIPRTGTETVLYLVPILIGYDMAYSDKLLLASQRENECHNYYPCSPFYGEECLSSFDEEIAALINYMQSLGLVNLKDDDKLFIIEQIVQAKRANKQRAYSESELEEYRKCLERRIDYLQAIYSESTKIAVRAVTMEWDRNAGRFYIKETHRDPAPINPYRNNNSRYSLKNYKDFLDFLNHPPLFRGYC